MNYSKTKLLMGFCLLSALAACSKKDNSATPENPVVTNPQPVKKGIQLATNAKFGAVLTDNTGKTLYFFAIDANGTSGCTGGCEVVWPVYYAAEASDNPGINAADLGEITRADGKKQSTYKGWPLYYYQGDAKAGDANGDGVGGTWFIGKPDYSLMLANNQLLGADGKQYTEGLTVGAGSTQYFTDANGRTLYAFSPDKANKNTFTKPDLSNNGVWPVYESDVKNIPSVLKAGSVAQITVFGKKQLTYKGWPLYYFGADAKRGDNKGVSVPTPGVWPVVKLSTTDAPLN